MSFLNALKSVFAPTPKPRTRPKAKVVVTPPIPKQRREPRKPTPPLELTPRVFKEALALVRRIAEERTSLPILGCCRIGEGKILATDLEQFIEIRLPGLDFAPVCVPVDLLQKLTKGSNGKLDLVPTEGGLAVNGTFVSGYDEKEWPAFIPPEGTKKVTFEIPKRWGDTIVASSTDLTRMPLYGVAIDLCKGAIVGSDGHRLHMVLTGKVETPWTQIPVIPRSAAQFVERLQAGRSFLVAPPFVECCVLISAAQKEMVPDFARFIAGPVTLWVRLGQSEFPDYTQVVPKLEVLTFVELPKKAFREALQSCIALSTPRVRSGVFTRMDGAVEVSFREPESLVTVRRTVPVENWPLTEPVGFNLVYFDQALQCLEKDTVRLGLKDVVSPIRIDEGEFTAVIMPMKIL